MRRNAVIALLCVAMSACLEAALFFDISTGNDLHVLKAGEEDQLAIYAFNGTLESVTTNVTFQITDINNNVVESKTVPVLITAQEDILIPLKAPAKFGPYILRCLEGEGDVRQQPPIRFVYMKPAGPRPKKDVSGFLFGNVLHYDYRMYRDDDFFRLANYMDYDRATRAMAWCGANVIRYDARWHLMEPKHGEWTPEYFDRAVKLLDKYNLGHAPILNIGTKWAIAKDWVPCNLERAQKYPWTSRPDYTYWREWVHKLLSEYGDHFDFLEVLNEVNLGINFTPDEYGELLRIAFEEARQLAPHVKVTSSGLGSLQATSRTSLPYDEWFERYAKAISENCDIECYHQHGPLGGLMAELALVEGFRSKYNLNHPFWFNEIGYAALGLNEEIVQAEVLFRKLLVVWSRGAIGYNWYNVRDKPKAEFPPDSAEAFFGVLTRDFHPKPVYNAFNTLTSNLFNAEMKGMINDDERAGKDVFAFLLKNEQPDTFTMPFFRTGNAATLQIVSNVTGNVTLIDLWGNETPVPSTDGTVAFKLDANPMMLRFENQPEAPELKGEFLAAGRQLIFTGSKQEMKFPVTNPTDEDMELYLKLAPLDGITFFNDEQTLTIPAGKTSEVAFECEVSNDFKDSVLEISVKAGSFWEGVCNIALGATIHVGEAFSEQPSLVIEDREMNSCLVAVSPEDEPLYWKGPDDCSAKVWLAQANHRLKLRIEAKDDVHSQPYHGTDVWQGDNVQIGIQIPRQDMYWEIGFTHCDDGTPEVFVWFAPTGFKQSIVTQRIKLETSRDENAKTTVYEAEIPFNAIGLTPEIGRGGFRFNLLVNDCDDGKTREGFMSFAPGLGDSKESTEFATICF